MIRYNYNEILDKEQNINIYEFSDDILELINSIALKVGSSNYIKTPVFTKKNKSFNKLNKVVVFEKKLDNLQKLQVNLNKLSVSVYDKLKDEILILISKIMEEDMITISELNNKILNLICIQRTNIDIYVKLFNEILNKYNLFKEECVSYLQKYKLDFENIKVFDPNIDYEEFCKNNKKNDNIKSKTLFYSRLSKIYNVEDNLIINLIKMLNDKLLKDSVHYLDNSPCEEYVENLYILISDNLNELKEGVYWDELLSNINFIRNIDKSIHKNITNKITFKYMDILDLIKK